MKWIVLIAIILALIFGAQVALNFAGGIWFLAVLVVFVGSALMAISSLLGAIKEKVKVLRNDKIVEMLSWAGVAVLFGWVLSFWF